MASGPQTPSAKTRRLEIAPLLKDGAKDAAKYVIPVLKAVSSAADAFPPLKSAAGGALFLAETARNFQTNKKEWMQFAKWVQQCVACVIASVPAKPTTPIVTAPSAAPAALAVPANSVVAAMSVVSAFTVSALPAAHASPAISTPATFAEALKVLNYALEVVIEEAKRLKGQSAVKRFLVYLKGDSEVSEHKARLDEAFRFFNLQATIAAHKNLESILHDTKALLAQIEQFKVALGQIGKDAAQARENAAGARDDIAEARMDIADKLRKAEDDRLLELLSREPGASWSRHLTCRPGTRQTILQEIMDFTSSSPQPPAHRIFLLTGVAGSGKTSIAHSAAERADKAPSTLITSFMFDRKVGRTTPNKLLSTIAHDLSNAVPSIRTSVVETLKDKRQLATAPLDQQFEHLILKPSESVPSNRIMTIVIDALDEGYSDDLLRVLSKDFALLPPNFRVVITSRDDPNIRRSLFACGHIEVREIDLHDDENRKNVADVARERLREIAKDHSWEDWPTISQEESFIAKAEGLFIWVTTACNYVAKSILPQKQLDNLLSGSLPPGASPTAKMDKLYADILAACPWEDEDFPSIYRSVMGAILALKAPLSVGALHKLLQPPGVDVATMSKALEHLGAVLTGLSNGRVRVLHQSFPDYIVDRAEKGKVQDICDGLETLFAIEPLEHNAILALRCLELLNTQLPELKAHSKLIDNDQNLIEPLLTLPSGHLLEALEYACQYLNYHLERVSPPQKPDSKLLTVYRDFLKGGNRITWMEVCAVQGLPDPPITEFTDWYRITGHEISEIDLDKFISNLGSVAQAHADRARWLSNLGIAHQSRFGHLGDLADLDHAIAVQEQAVALTPDGHAAQADRLHNLGISLKSRFDYRGALVDLDSAIDTLQRALNLKPDDHTHRAQWLTDLGAAFESRFDDLGELADLDLAMESLQRAVFLTLDVHAGKVGWFSNLKTSSSGSQVGHPCKHTGLDRAIECLRRAVALAPEGHVDKARWLNSLGVALQGRFNGLGELPDIIQAFSAYSQMAATTSISASARLTAARRWARLCVTHRQYLPPNAAINAYTLFIELIIRVTSLGKATLQRHNAIPVMDFGRVITNAVTEAVICGELELALEWFEQGQTLIGNQLFSPIHDLRVTHPGEAEKLETLSRDLQYTATGAINDNHLAHTIDALESAARNRRLHGEENEQLLERIRTLDGFATFMKPKAFTELRQAALSGPVVVVNIQRGRCDALIIHPSSSTPTHLILPMIDALQGQALQVELAELFRGGVLRHCVHFDADYGFGVSGPGRREHFVNMLGQLWERFAEPVLAHLGFLNRPLNGNLPHITWCVNRHLDFLPIHAAGQYSLYEVDGPKIFDFVVSSYAPSLTAMLNHKDRRPGPSSRIIQALGVSQTMTPGLCALPFTKAEIETILELCNGRLDLHWLNDKEATVSAVLDGMLKCNWIHLACHGGQIGKEVGFHLADGQLTLQDIMRNSFAHVEFAVLSACTTGISNDQLPETINLATGMLMAGCSSVVATMWPILDSDGPIIAKGLYEYLFEEGGGDSTRAAYALHYAVKRLRQEVGDYNFERWVPFIHLGI